MKKVVKFGGSSLADAHQFSKVADIIHADESRVFVIPSAPGKRFDGDTKVTDMLYRCYEKAAAGEHYEDELIAIRSRYDSIIQELGLEGFTLDEDFAKIRAHLAGTPERDFVASRGEYLNGRIMARYLNYEFIDAADVIFFDEDGVYMPEKTVRAMRKRLEKAGKAVIPGFYGMGEDGRVRTFSRGGSDVTGSIVARACKADVYENWTDVSGFLMADPRIIEGPAEILSLIHI